MPDLSPSPENARRFVSLCRRYVEAWIHFDKHAAPERRFDARLAADLVRDEIDAELRGLDFRSPVGWDGNFRDSLWAIIEGLKSLDSGWVRNREHGWRTIDGTPRFIVCASPGEERISAFARLVDGFEQAVKAGTRPPASPIQAVADFNARHDKLFADIRRALETLGGRSPAPPSRPPVIQAEPVETPTALDPNPTTAETVETPAAFSPPGKRRRGPKTKYDHRKVAKLWRDWKASGLPTYEKFANARGLDVEYVKDAFDAHRKRVKK